MLRATSPCLLSAVQLSWLVLSAGCYLGALLNLSTVLATCALSVSVLLETDPWPPGLHRPWIDLSLVLLFQPCWPALPWEISFILSLIQLLSLLLAPSVMEYLVGYKASRQHASWTKKEPVKCEKYKFKPSGHTTRIHYDNVITFISQSFLMLVTHWVNALWQFHNWIKLKQLYITIKHFHKETAQPASTSHQSHIFRHVFVSIQMQT